VVPDLPVPTFVKDFPVDTSPLTRQHRRTAGLVEKWDLYIRSVESATAYSELVDPVVQRERFEAQVALTAAGDDEAMPLDEDFLTAMEYGMLPSGGMGMGIDRLLMRSPVRVSARPSCFLWYSHNEWTARRADFAILSKIG
jgi:lysyl-tRNA synthetase class 2